MHVSIKPDRLSFCLSLFHSDTANLTSLSLVCLESDKMWCYFLHFPFPFSFSKRKTTTMAAESLKSTSCNDYRWTKHATTFYSHSSSLAPCYFTSPLLHPPFPGYPLGFWMDVYWDSLGHGHICSSLFSRIKLLGENNNEDISMYKWKQ